MSIAVLFLIAIFAASGEQQIRRIYTKTNTFVIRSRHQQLHRQIAYVSNVYVRVIRSCL